MGLSLSQWGPSGWNILHVFSHHYPSVPNDVDKKLMFGFIHSFAVHIPCPTCKAHFSEHLLKHLPSPSSDHLSSKEKLVEFMNNCHNVVNKRCGKKEFTLEEHYAVYFPPPSSNKAYGQMAIVVSIALLAIFSARQYRKSCAD